MRNKKAMSAVFEVILWATICLVILLFVLGISGKFFPTFGRWFNNTFTNMTAADLAPENSQTECFGVDGTSDITLKGGEIVKITPSLSNNVLTLKVANSSGEIDCNYGRLWTFNIGEQKCCESPATQLCVKFMKISSSSETGDCAEIAYLSKDELKLPTSYPLCADDKECSNSVDFWSNSKKYTLTFVRATVSPLTFTKYATFSAVTYDEKGNKVNACNENTFTVESGDVAACSNAEGQAFIVDLQKLPTFTTPNKVTISIRSGTPMVLKGG
jgi:hypothetical protein